MGVVTILTPQAERLKPRGREGRDPRERVGEGRESISGQVLVVLGGAWVGPTGGRDKVSENHHVIVVNDRVNESELVILSHLPVLLPRGQTVECTLMVVIVRSTSTWPITPLPLLKYDMPLVISCLLITSSV